MPKRSRCTDVLGGLVTNTLLRGVMLGLLVSTAHSGLAQEPIPLPGDATKEDGKFEWGWGGYFENTLNVEYIEVEQEGAVVNAARGRLDFSCKYKGRFDLGASVVGILYSGQTEIDTVRYFPQDLRDAMVPPDPGLGLPGAEELLKYEIESRLYFQEAFGTLYLPGFWLRVGRHKFYSGTGYAFNPIDLFNRKDPLDPTYEIDGLDAVLGAFELAGQTELHGIVRFDDDFSRTDYEAKLKTYRRGWDIGLQYTNYLDERVDWEMLNTKKAIWALANGESQEAFTRKARWNLVAGEFAGEVAGLGIHGEGGYVFVDTPQEIGSLSRAADNHARFLVGTDYTFESQWYVLVEYMRLGQGVAASPHIGLNDRMALLTGEVLAIGKDTLFGRISYPLTDLTEVSVNTIVNANDPSFLINPWVVADLHPGVKLTATLYIPVGDEHGQLGRMGLSGFVRVKVYF